MNKLKKNFVFKIRDFEEWNYLLIVKTFERFPIVRKEPFGYIVIAPTLMIYVITSAITVLIDSENEYCKEYNELNGIDLHEI